MNKTILLCSLVLSLAFTACKDKDNGNSESLAKSTQTITYELPLKIEADKPEWMSGLDRQKLMKGLFEKVENNELVAYDPFDLQVETILTWENIRENMGALEDTVEALDSESGKMKKVVVEGRMFFNEIGSMIFIEEWSVDENGAIHKEVLGVGPVRHYYRSEADKLTEDQPLKKIAFICYFSDKRPPLFEI
jgi:hypothetical protein